MAAFASPVFLTGHAPLRLSSSHDCRRLQVTGRRRAARMCDDVESAVPDAAPAAEAAAAAATPALGPVFVAGATGRTGQRVCRLLVEAGVPVLAGCRTKSKLADVGLGGELVSHVPYEVEDKSGPNFGDVTAVVCCLGAAEVFSLTAPARIDGFGSARLLRAAAEAPSVQHIYMVSSIGVGNPFAWPAGILNLFGGVLLWKEYAEKALREAAIANGKSYLIVRPGGLERAKDDYQNTHNLRLSTPNSLGGGQVSRLQIAQLIVEGIKNPQLARNKTVEAVAETTAPKRPLADILRDAPQDS